MEVGREDVENFLGIMERVAVANERLIELATEERNTFEDQPGPSFCPHCQTLNPKINTDGASGDGPMSSFVLVARCTHCNNAFYGIPVGWDIAATMEDAKEIRNAKAGDENGNAS